MTSTTSFDPSLFAITIRKEFHDGAPLFAARVAGFPDVIVYQPTMADAYTTALDVILGLYEMGREANSPFLTVEDATSDQRDDFGHFLSYTGYSFRPADEIERLKIAYEHGADSAPSGTIKERLIVRSLHSVGCPCAEPDYVPPTEGPGFCNCGDRERWDAAMRKLCSPPGLLLINKWIEDLDRYESLTDAQLVDAVFAAFFNCTNDTQDDLLYEMANRVHPGWENEGIEGKPPTAAEQAVIDRAKARVEASLSKQPKA